MYLAIEIHMDYTLYIQSSDVTWQIIISINITIGLRHAGVRGRAPWSF